MREQGRGGAIGGRGRVGILVGVVPVVEEAREVARVGRVE